MVKPNLEWLTPVCLFENVLQKQNALQPCVSPEKKAPRIKYRKINNDSKINSLRLVH